MSRLEAEAAEVINSLESQRSREISPVAKSVMSWFLAMQWYRHRFLIDYIRSEAERTRTSSADDGDETVKLANSAVLRVGVSTLLGAWQVKDDLSLRPKERWNPVASTLAGLHWRIMRYEGSKVLMGDNMLCLSGMAHGDISPLPPKWADHGIGTSLDQAARITVPLMPSMALVLSRGSAPTHIAAKKLNELTVFNSREFVLANPAWAENYPDLHRCLRDSLWTQRQLMPIIRSKLA
jgi:hypothetical protein